MRSGTAIWGAPSRDDRRRAIAVESAVPAERANSQCTLCLASCVAIAAGAAGAATVVPLAGFVGSGGSADAERKTDQLGLLGFQRMEANLAVGVLSGQQAAGAFRLVADVVLCLTAARIVAAVL